MLHLAAQSEWHLPFSWPLQEVMAEWRLRPLLPNQVVDQIIKDRSEAPQHARSNKTWPATLCHKTRAVFPTFPVPILKDLWHSQAATVILLNISFFEIWILFVCLFSPSQLMRLDLRVTHCPTLLYPKDPEMPRTTKVRKKERTITFSVKWFVHTSVEIFFKVNKKQHYILSYIQSKPRPTYYVNTSHNPNSYQEWESIGLETELKLCYLFLLISSHLCDVLIVGINSWSNLG